MTTTLAKGISLLDVPSSEYQKLGLDSLVEFHNTFSESIWGADKALSRLLLQHELFKAAIEGVGNSVIVEIGHYGAITLDQLAKKFSVELPGALVIGLDKGDYEPKPVLKEFEYSVNPAYLLRAEESVGRQVFNPGWVKASRLGKVYRHGTNPNAFAVYDATAEQALLPDAADLILIKSMLGYFGRTEAESLKYFLENVLPKAKRFLIADYIGKCNFTKVRIPRPEAVAQTITTAYSNASISFQTGENQFILYARR